MKRFVLLVITVFMLALNVSAKNMPMYTNSINVEGIGVIRLPQIFNVYEKPDLNSKTVAKYVWGKAAGAYVNDSDYSDNFIVMNEENNIAFMTVVNDSDTEGWYEVCYDQKNKLTGWVYPQEYEFYSWVAFFKKYGKLNGVYFYKDIPEKNKKLYSQPDENSQNISTFKLIKDARVQTFKGDWVLLRIYEYDKGIKIGWFKWRTDEGKFYLFPKVE